MWPAWQANCKMQLSLLAHQVPEHSASDNLNNLSGIYIYSKHIPLSGSLCSSWACSWQSTSSAKYTPMYDQEGGLCTAVAVWCCSSALQHSLSVAQRCRTCYGQPCCCPAKYLPAWSQPGPWQLGPQVGCRLWSYTAVGLYTEYMLFCWLCQLWGTP